MRHSLSSPCNTAELALPLIPNHPTLGSTCIMEDGIFLPFNIIIIIIIAVFSVSILNKTKTSITRMAQDYLLHSHPQPGAPHVGISSASLIPIHQAWFNLPGVCKWVGSGTRWSWLRGPRWEGHWLQS